MKSNNKLHLSIWVLLLSLLQPAAALAARDYSRVVVFGDSLSDPGNAFVLTGMALTPPYTTAIPDYPYARGGHHLSNGSTWIEQLATNMKLGNSVGPALRVPGKFSNYAIDRTRACTNSFSPSHIDLSAQVGQFLGQFGGDAPDDALYVLFVGSNDVRDALTVFLGTGNQALADSFVECALLSIYANIDALINAGAANFLVANVPNLGLVPAVAALGPVAQGGATMASEAFNEQLEQILGGFKLIYGGSVSFDLLDTFALITAAEGNHPELDVKNPCISFSDGSVCAPAKDYLFWDGIHPTKTGHKLIAEEAENALGLN